MLLEFLDALFGCNHRFGFPIRLKGGETAYQVCIRCGAEYEYDWKQMRRLGPRKQQPVATRAPTLPKVA